VEVKYVTFSTFGVHWQKLEENKFMKVADLLT
jgi:hypothetical protein